MKAPTGFVYVTVAAIPGLPKDMPGVIAIPLVELPVHQPQLLSPPHRAELHYPVLRKLYAGR